MTSAIFKRAARGGDKRGGLGVSAFSTLIGMIAAVIAGGVQDALYCVVNDWNLAMNFADDF
ncbi:hypothetical protein AAGR22_02155 [Erwinia sp. HDF1-3R]|uniref:hypothetical protein n=1 Tax=Erwinia sp. HDF1-3R TaxID=3141543 RepID=UPI0031F518F9